MDYCEITVRTNTQNAELVAYFLQEVCMDGVSIYDKNDLDSSKSWDYKDDGAELVYEDEVLVKGYCEQTELDSVLKQLQNSLSCLTDAGSLKVTVATVDGNAWVAKWKETFRPIETQKLVICPEWQDVQTQKTVFKFDSGVAFGTGQHETTSMCLDFAEKMNLSGKTVLDVGCGSGILGLCALLLGAKNATLVDIDSQATDVAKHNAEVNGLAKKSTVITGDLTTDVTGTFDVVFANLTADILALLYEGIGKVVHSGTFVVLSGILDVRLAEVIALYTKTFTHVATLEKGEWRALLLKLN